MLKHPVNRRQVIQVTAQAALGLAAFGGSLPASAKASDGALPRLGSSLTLPDVTLLDGRLWRAAEMQSKTLVVYWWASWCPFCAAQSPHIEALWRAQKANGLEVLALSIDRQAAAASSYLLPKPVGLPVVVVLKVKGQQGKVVFAESGEMFPEDIEGLKKYL